MARSVICRLARGQGAEEWLSNLLMPMGHELRNGFFTRADRQRVYEMLRFFVGTAS